MIYDVIIIGKGPAGVSASLYTSRAGLKTLILGSGIGALERAEKIENFYGCPEALSGQDLSERGICQAQSFGVEIKSEEVVHINMEDFWLVKTVTNQYQARSILLATGKSRAGLKVPGFQELRGKGISFCATCDGFLYRNKKLAVIGSGDYAATELLELMHFSKDITLFTDGKKIDSSLFPENIAIETRRIIRFEGSEKLSGLSLEGNEMLKLDGVFVAIGTAGAAEFASKIGIEVNNTDIVVDDSFMTNISGIFAAGDCIGGFFQVAKAVSDGALAAKNIISFLKHH